MLGDKCLTKLPYFILVDFFKSSGLHGAVAGLESFRDIGVRRERGCCVLKSALHGHFGHLRVHAVLECWLGSGLVPKARSSGRHSVQREQVIVIRQDCRFGHHAKAQLIDGQHRVSELLLTWTIGLKRAILLTVRGTTWAGGSHMWE